MSDDCLIKQVSVGCSTMVNGYVLIVGCVLHVYP